MVTIEHTSSPVPRNFHGDSLGYTAVNHVSDRCSPEVVANESGYPCSLACGRPRLPKVLSLQRRTGQRL